MARRTDKGKDLTSAEKHDTLSLTDGRPIPGRPLRKGTTVQTKIGKFSFAIPEGHPQAGEKIEKSFDYKVCDNDTEAQAIVTEKKWSLSGLVNDVLKANARSNAYQAALLPYRPSEVSPEEIKERMVRDYIRLGIPEDVARKQVEALLAASAAAQATT